MADGMVIMVLGAKRGFSSKLDISSDIVGRSVSDICRLSSDISMYELTRIT